MPQSLTGLSDMHATNEGYMLEIKSGEIQSMSSQENIQLHEHLSEFVMRALKHDMMFFKDYQQDYHQVAEHCAREIEENDDAFHYTMLYLADKMSIAWDVLMQIIRMDPQTRKHKNMLEEIMIKSEFLHAAENCRQNIMKEDRTREYVIEMFRQSGSFTQLGVRLDDSRHRYRMENIEERYWDAIAKMAQKIISENNG